MKIIACLICLLLSLPLFAQKGLFIGANAGMGFTNMSYRRTGFPGSFGEIHHEREPGFSAGIDVGFRRQRWFSIRARSHPHRLPVQRRVAGPERNNR